MRIDRRRSRDARRPLVVSSWSSPSPSSGWWMARTAGHGQANDEAPCTSFLQVTFDQLVVPVALRSPSRRIGHEDISAGVRRYQGQAIPVAGLTGAAMGPIERVRGTRTDRRAPCGGADEPEGHRSAGLQIAGLGEGRGVRGDHRLTGTAVGDHRDLRRQRRSRPRHRDELRRVAAAGRARGKVSGITQEARDPVVVAGRLRRERASDRRRPGGGDDGNADRTQYEGRGRACARVGHGTDQ